MLTSTGFGDHTLFTHAQGQQRLPQGVIDLVGTGVIEVFSLEPDARTAIRAAVVGGEPFGFIQRCGPADVIAQQAIQFGGEGRILPGLSGSGLQLRQGRHQRFRDVLTAVATEASPRGGSGADGQICIGGLRRQGAGHRATDRVCGH